MPAACVVPMVIGCLSGSPTKAALSAAILMCSLVFIAGNLHYLPVSDDSIEKITMLSLAFIPGTMILGLIGYSARCVLRRLLTRASIL